ncbi:hypothetical protein BACDOR_01224 [Phocaeicola dorei DSM 17855]|uniref:Uncharacterized protein n=1 Tax=Phocaeicola dorei DSM 17855 TaxID=483217 RepID=B6VVB6_9BACT|nr:hypothetical protein BACDOR_01224 [Phocaeicola dorei DSM 17855]
MFVGQSKLFHLDYALYFCFYSILYIIYYYKWSEINTIWNENRVLWGY